MLGAGGEVCPPGLPARRRRCHNSFSIKHRGKTMPETLNELKSIEDFNRVLEESAARPVLLFKHSLTCPISARAFREFQSYLEEAEAEVSYNLITVQTARAVSNEAASRLRVEHHSPQAILVRDG